MSGLRYVSDATPGFTRRRRGETFSYFDQRGRRLTSAPVLERIRRLAIPPAWTDVWICPQADGHLQATGHDARGRKQYRYHTEWSAARAATKFDRMADFGRALPKIRRQVASDLRRPPLSRPAVLATLVRLLETTLIRVGNEEYVRANGSYGLTTLQDRHVSFKPGMLRFHFRGKSGKRHEVEVHDPRLARRVRQLQELPGQDLFHWMDENGKLHPIASDDINAYLHAIAGDEFSAKDFRTWAGTLAAACELGKLRGESPRLSKRQITGAIERVADQLGNTPSVCRKSYIHPAVIDSCREGAALAVASSARSATGLSPAEKALLRFLRTQRAGEAEKLRKSLRNSLRARVSKKNGR